MPPVRDASTKPIAATVLPAPVACSNQKRLCALGSSRRPRATSSSTSSGASSNSSKATRLGRLLLVVLLLELVDEVEVEDELRLVGVGVEHLGLVVRRRARARARGRRARGCPRRSALRPAAPSACRRARRPDGGSASCRRPACGSSSDSTRSRPEQQRVAPAPLRRRHLAALLDLAQRRVQRAPAAGAGRERVRRGLTGVDEALEREALRALDRRRIGNRCGLDDRRRGLSHLWPSCGKGAAEGTSVTRLGASGQPPERPSTRGHQGLLAPRSPVATRIAHVAGGTRWRVCHPVPVRRRLLPRRRRSAWSSSSSSGSRRRRSPRARRRPSGARSTRPQVRARLAGAPARLARLHRNANGFLPGEDEALKRELRRLRGHPVVVNVWAAWCGPCRQELPVFQEVSVAQGKRVAFLGVDVRDNRAGRREAPARDPGQLSERGGPGQPDLPGPQARRASRRRSSTTAEGGEPAFVHQGPYPTAPTSRPTSAATRSGADDRGARRARRRGARRRARAAPGGLRRGAGRAAGRGARRPRRRGPAPRRASTTPPSSGPAACSTTATRSSWAGWPSRRARGAAASPARLLEEAEAQARARGVVTDLPLLPDRRATRSTSTPATSPTASCSSTRASST